MRFSIKFKLLFVLISSNILWSLDTIEPLEKYKKGKVAQITFVNDKPKIDGIGDDEIWDSAIPINDFVQTDPVNMGKPTQKTEVRLLYNNQTIFVLADLA